MDKKRVGQIKEQYDLAVHNERTTNIEFWYARELMTLDLVAFVPKETKHFLAVIPQWK